MRRVLALGLVALLAVVGVWLGTGQALVSAWKLREHARVHSAPGGDPYLFPGAWVARYRDLYDPVLGPQLLMNPAVVENRLKDLASLQDPEALLRHRGLWAWCYAALRAQGAGDQAIQARPEGPQLVLGVLAAEAHPPESWSRALWLSRKLSLRPQDTYSLGLLPGPQAAEALQRLGTRLSRDRVDLMMALTTALCSHEDLLPPEQVDQAFQDWTALVGRRFGAQPEVTLQAALKVRSRITELFAGQPCRLNLGWDRRVPGDLQGPIGEAVVGFLRCAGVHPVNGPMAVDLRLLPLRFEAGGWPEVPQVTVVNQEALVVSLPSVPSSPRLGAGLVVRIKAENFALPPIDWDGLDAVHTALLSADDPSQMRVLKDWLEREGLKPWNWGRSTGAFEARPEE